MTPEGGWQLNIGGFIAHYRPRGWLVRGGFEGIGWTATHLNHLNQPTPGLATLADISLDGLAGQIDAARVPEGG